MWYLVVLVIGLSCGRAKHTIDRESESIGLRTSLTAADCSDATQDADADGLDDQCEFDLAMMFAPELVIDPADCLWQAGATPPRLRGGYLFAAQPLGRLVRIAFLSAYQRDCGWSGAACAVGHGVAALTPETRN